MSQAEMIAFLIFVSGFVWTLNAMPLAKRLVDMTYILDETNHHYPGFKDFKIDSLINGTQESFGGLWLQAEEFSSATHVGTHMDAPSHFVMGGKTIDEIPVSEFIAPAAVIDIVNKAALNPDAVATIEDLLQWESVTQQSLNGTIVLLRSGWGNKWNDRDAYYGTTGDDKDTLHFPGFAAEASHWLIDNREVKGVGTDALSIDNGPSSDFPSHRILLGKGIFALENVANMEQIPLYGAKLYVLPMKISKGSGAPTRIIASIPEVIFNTSNE